MKNISFLIAIALTAQLAYAQDKIDLSGTWHFAVDPENVGVADRWFDTELSDSLSLPGSMLTNGKGEAVDIRTPWVGQRVDKSFFRDDRYAPYRKADNFKVPFWLQPNLYYAGPAWYQRDVDVPADWEGHDITMFFERAHWDCRVWVDDTEVGHQNALSAPQLFDLSGRLTPGHHRLTLRIDNAIDEIDPGENSHSVSEHTQGNWNGVVGDMYLACHPTVHFGQIDLYPSLASRTMRVKLVAINGGSAKTYDMSFRISGEKVHSLKQSLQPGDNILEITIPLPDSVEAWDEFAPNLYELDCRIGKDKQPIDQRTISFGCRDLSTEGGTLQVNGRPAFMRGTLHCAAFPLTGYPATDVEEWMREFSVCKEHGLNHVRFHSWCPPEAAFKAADQLGIYLQIECSSWANQSTTLGDGKPIDRFVIEEAERIVRAYGNHPSFCFMAYGNEPGGDHYEPWLTRFVEHWKQADPRRLYTSAAGWPNLPVNDYLSDSTPRIQQWGQELGSIINAESPSTTYDWGAYTSRFEQPFISHEIGQWCVYPNFEEMTKYTGVYQPRNFEIFRETLEQNGMSSLARDFLYASGKLQTLCYKADIEAALRTPGFGGFQLLGLNDFPGQGTALVGSLDAFWEGKGYVSAEEYSRFCNSLVPLARIPKLVLENNETLMADVEVANFLAPLTDAQTSWIIRDAEGRTIGRGELPTKDIPMGNCQRIGHIEWELSGIKQAMQLNLEVTIAGHANDWDFFVYPAVKTEPTTDVLLTDTLDQAALDVLDAGGSVLLSYHAGSIAQGYGGEVAVGFSSIFWNTSWTSGQAPHTLGILCDPSHPALDLFPTACHSNYQWQDPLRCSGAIRIDKLNAELKPIVRLIDDWFTNRPIGLIVEAKVGKGRLLISGVDFHQDMDNRPAARQLLLSLEHYMQSDDFQPTAELTVEEVRKISER